jgi:sporulation protein YlmC with PRC-barrel domain
MKRTLVLMLASIAIAVPTISSAEVAGSSLLGITMIELRQVAHGWSAKRQVLGQSVYNDKAEKIGSVDDLIISPEKSLSYAIIGVGGFLNVGRHDVAVPVGMFKEEDHKLVLAGATKDVLEAMPAFEYAKN